MTSHVSTPYQLLPQPGSHAPRPARLSLWTAIRYTLIICATIVIAHGLLQLVAPEHPYTSSVRSALLRPHAPVYDGIGYQLKDVSSEDVGRQGTFYRDPTPIKTLLSFWELAEKEVEQRGLDTCWGKLGRRFIDEYHSTDLAYCVPPGDETAAEIRNASRYRSHDDQGSLPATYMTCSAIHRNEFTNWWPYPAAPCISTNLRMIEGGDRAYRAAGCEVTNDGTRLISQMARESFAGRSSTLVGLDSEEAKCEQVVDHTVLLVHRQDQWNPFHVAEDLITTVVTLLLAARNAPDLTNDRIQVVFSEGFGMDQNHFTPLWDRIGAWAPRRLNLDPWAKGVCLTNAIHSVGAGASFLSAPGVSNSFQCASSITWAASHYYRHLFGLLPPSLSVPVAAAGSPLRGRRPINVLWLSRAKLDAYAMKHDDWSKWRGVRHLSNEPDLLQGIRDGMRTLCTDAGVDCVFQDALEDPDTWSDVDIVKDGQPIPIRFTSIDPTVHALGTQIHHVGHTTILVSSHGGALGLSLFMPPGDGVIVELQVKEVSGNYHFEHMAYELGHAYEQLRIKRAVNVDMVWDVIKQHLEGMLGVVRVEEGSVASDGVAEGE